MENINPQTTNPNWDKDIDNEWKNIIWNTLLRIDIYYQ